ncbi:MAG: prevent-host-death family protein [Nostoc sp.]
MIYLSATEAKHNFAKFLDQPHTELITIQRHDQHLVVVLSVAEDQKLKGFLKEEFWNSCDLKH